MLEEVVADASIPVDAEADAEDDADFRRFLDQVSPAELVRQIGRARSDAPSAPPDDDTAGDEASGGGGEDDPG
jgi:hypothetical protein